LQDVAGVIEAVGPNVTRFKVGDSVFGDILGSCGKHGALAEFALGPETDFHMKPEGLSFVQAASLPQSGTVALQAVAYAKPTDRLVINGAGGGGGTFVIQLARQMGIKDIVAVDSSTKAELMLSLGATQVIDYTKQDMTVTDKPYDLIIDLVGHHTLSEFEKCLAPNGRYVIVGGQMSLLLSTLVWSKWISWRTGKQMSVLAVETNKDMPILIDHILKGRVKTVVDQVYPFAKTPEAMQYLGDGHTQGKVVITMD
jgi:NADPH:quinone reductase-like Zn-dependent oxidoreductase